jgi:two-component system sensor histidine kinase BarA
MDIQMPRMNGIDATMKIRENELPGRHIPIIALTAHAVASEKESAINAGMDDYLTKPIDTNALEDVIEKWGNSPSIYDTKPPPKIEESFTDRFVPILKAKIPVKEPSPVDWKMALDLAGNQRALAKDMLVGLMHSLDTAHHLINQSFEDNDLQLLREEVHRLHGACCYCGVPDLKAVLGKLETAIVNKNEIIIAQEMIAYNKQVGRLQKYVEDHNDIFAATT